MANPDRQGGGGLSLRTLAIASAASMTAAMVTSRLFPPGTVYAAALTPVIVAAVSELLSRPVERLSDLREQRRTMVLETREAQRHGARGQEAGPLRGAPGFAQGADAPEAATNGGGEVPPVRVHGRDRRARAASAARRVHPKVWLATGLAAFALAAAALTLPELIFGGAVASEDRTTFFGGSDTGRPEPERGAETQTQPEPAETTTETAPSQTPPTGTETETAPTPAETQTETAPAPSGGAPAPSETGTEPTPAPDDQLPLP